MELPPTNAPGRYLRSGTSSGRIVQLQEIRVSSQGTKTPPDGSTANDGVLQAAVVRAMAPDTTAHASRPPLSSPHRESFHVDVSTTPARSSQARRRGRGPPGISAGVVLASHPFFAWQDIAPMPVAIDARIFSAPADTIEEHVTEPPSNPMSEQGEIPRSTTPAPDASSTAPKSDAPLPQPSRRKRPVVEITVRSRKSRKVSSPSPKERSPSPERASSPETDSYVPSGNESDSESEVEVEDDEPVQKRQRRTPSLSPVLVEPRRPRRGRRRLTERQEYARKTDWERHVFTSLHGEIRCLFCPPVSSGVKVRGTIHRLPDAAARHLRDWCPYFERSDVYKRVSEENPNVELSKKEVVARVVKQYEKIAVAQVFCRNNEEYVKKCAELQMSPANVESKLGRHAMLFKVEDCACCPHPSWTEWVASKGASGASGRGKKTQQQATNGNPGRAKGKGTRTSPIEVIEEDEEVAETKPEIKREETETPILQKDKFWRDSEKENMPLTPSFSSSLSGSQEDSEDEVALMVDGRLDMIIAC
ncbi:hypothetical protein C8Q74DRAFT_1369566 [Fomes fomentarius]|nr:hypothetical protein C8Q74DRAFT_1369566 [Fomes fomentarius]